MKSISKEHRNNFFVYLRWFRSQRCFLKYNRCTCFIPWRVSPLARGYGDTIRAWVEIESTGKTNIIPRHPHILTSVQEGKKLLNWQIKQWTEGSIDPCCTILSELRSDYPWLPEWVWKALRRSVIS